MAYDADLEVNQQAMSDMVEAIAGSYDEVDSDEDLIEDVLDILCDVLNLEPADIKQRVVEGAYARGDDEDDDESGN